MQQQLTPQPTPPKPPPAAPPLEPHAPRTPNSPLADHQPPPLKKKKYEHYSLTRPFDLDRLEAWRSSLPDSSSRDEQAALLTSAGEELQAGYRGEVKQEELNKIKDEENTLHQPEPHTTYYSPIKKAPLFFPFSLDRLPLVQGAVDIQRERDDGKVVMQAGRIGKATMQAGENNGEERRYDDLGGGDEVHDDPLRSTSPTLVQLSSGADSSSLPPLTDSSSSLSSLSAHSSSASDASSSSSSSSRSKSSKSSSSRGSSCSTASNYSSPLRLSRKKTKITLQPPTPKVDKSDWIEPECDLKRFEQSGMPPIWCEGRQELCESLSYFKAYEGGHYNSRELCHGYLLDSFPSPTDQCSSSGRIIISHLGGLSSPTSQQRSHVRVRSLIHNLELGVPVVLIAGSEWSKMAYLKEKGARYAVLGWYRVTAVWPESERKIVDNEEENDAKTLTRFKVKFEWLENQGKPWFEDVVKSSAPPIVEENQNEKEKVYCSTCDMTFDKVFSTPEITCYNELCSSFFLDPLTSLPPPPTSLIHSPTFLHPTPSPLSPPLVPHSLFPPPLSSSSLPRLSQHTHAAWRGLHCPSCGRLSSRKDWDRVECANEGCESFVEGLRGRKYLSEELSAAVAEEEEEEGEEGKGWEHEVVELAKGAKVHLLRPKGTEEKEMMERLLSEYQEDDVGKFLERRELKKHRLAGKCLTNQWSFNTGKKYHYVVDQPSIAFSSDDTDRKEGEKVAPGYVKEAKEVLEKVCRDVIEEKEEEWGGFNEVLSVAYMEGGKMNFHDDGEPGLGPIVASLSLGSEATMTFRRKKTKGVEAEEKTKSRKSRIVLKLTLRHGDVVVMEGADVQKQFEHKVETTSLRFVATARYIGKKNKAPKRGSKKRGAGKKEVEKV